MEVILACRTYGMVGRARILIHERNCLRTGSRQGRKKIRRARNREMSEVIGAGQGLPRACLRARAQAFRVHGRALLCSANQPALQGKEVRALSSDNSAYQNLPERRNLLGIHYLLARTSKSCEFSADFCFPS